LLLGNGKATEAGEMVERLDLQNRQHQVIFVRTNSSD